MMMVLNMAMPVWYMLLGWPWLRSAASGCMPIITSSTVIPAWYTPLRIQPERAVTLKNVLRWPAAAAAAAMVVVPHNQVSVRPCDSFMLSLPSLLLSRSDTCICAICNWLVHCVDAMLIV